MYGYGVFDVVERCGPLEIVRCRLPDGYKRFAETCVERFADRFAGEICGRDLRERFAGEICGRDLREAFAARLSTKTTAAGAVHKLHGSRLKHEQYLGTKTVAPALVARRIRCHQATMPMMHQDPLGQLPQHGVAAASNLKSDEE